MAYTQLSEPTLFTNRGLFQQALFVPAAVMSKSPYALDRRQAARAEIELCSTCGASIALVPPNDNAPAAPWKCRGCGTIYLACAQRRSGTEFQGGVRPAFYMDVIEHSAHRPAVQPLDLSAEDLRQLQRCLPESHPRGGNARSSQRYQVATPITVLPLADDFRIDGAITAASTLDVSCGGLALLSRRPLEAKYLAIEFLDSGARMPALILRPSRCTPLGCAFAIAGDFVSRIAY